jgi:hypothetical protein
MNGDKLRRYVVGALVALAVILVGLDRLFRAAGIGGVSLPEITRPAPQIDSQRRSTGDAAAAPLRLAVEWIRCKPATADGYSEVSGSVRNLSSAPAERVRLALEYRDASGSPSGADIVSPTPATIPAGERAVFTVIAKTPAGTTAVVASAETAEGPAAVEAGNP